MDLSSGLGDSSKVLLGSSHRRVSHTWWGPASQQPLPPISFHLEAEKEEEKVRRRQLSPRFLREPQWANGSSGRCADGVLLLINPNLICHLDIGYKTLS